MHGDGIPSPKMNRPIAIGIIKLSHSYRQVHFYTTIMHTDYALHFIYRTRNNRQDAFSQIPMHTGPGVLHAMPLDNSSEKQRTYKHCSLLRTYTSYYYFGGDTTD